MVYELKNTMVITNNNLVRDKYKDDVKLVFLNTYEEVLLKTRDEVYKGMVLLTHPQASSLKPNQTLFRTIMLYPNIEKEDMTEGIQLIEKCIRVFYEWQNIRKSPDSYITEKVTNDFKIIDLSVIDEVIKKVY